MQNCHWDVFLSVNMYADYKEGSTRSQKEDGSYAKDLSRKVKSYVINAHATFGFKIKYFLTSHDVNAETVEQQRHLVFDPDNLPEYFLGQEWDLKNDTI